MRAAVDLCHRDGSLKREVAENPAKYIHEVRHPPLQCEHAGWCTTHMRHSSFSSSGRISVS